MNGALRHCRWTAVGLLAGFLLVGCARPAPPDELLDPPADLPGRLGERRLFHTPQAYIYARSDFAAGEADRWVREVKRYVLRQYSRALPKGVVIVMDVEDAPVARSLEDLRDMERDPVLRMVLPRKQKSPDEVRRTMAETGIPEAPIVRAASIVLPPGKLAEMGLHAGDVPWAMVAPSHELAVECGLRMAAAGVRHRRPDLTDEQARGAVGWMKNMLAEAFETMRGHTLFLAWVARQDDWSDEQKREAIRRRLPKSPDVEW